MDQIKKHRVGIIAIVVLVGVAVVFDIVTFFLPGAGDVLGPIFWAVVAGYFVVKGMGFVNPRRLVTGAMSVVAELIPIVQALPTLTVGIIMIIGMTRVEEKTGIKVSSVVSGKPGVGAKMNADGMRAAAPKIPLHEGDFRPPNGGVKA